MAIPSRVDENRIVIAQDWIWLWRQMSRGHRIGEGKWRERSTWRRRNATWAHAAGTGSDSSEDERKGTAECRESRGLVAVGG